MGKSIFTGTAWIEIQGKCVLRLLERHTDYSKYRIHGFQDPITIEDHRLTTRTALAGIMDYDRDVNEFAPQFNAPALVHIESDSTGTSIQLQDTDDHDPQHRLWIAIGIQDSIPVYDYIFDRLVPMNKDNFAFVALYRRVYQPELASTLVVSSV